MPIATKYEIFLEMTERSFHITCSRTWCHENRFQIHSKLLLTFVETEDGVSSFWVRVKRVLKGELPLHGDNGDELMKAKEMTVKIRTTNKPKAQQDCYKRPIRVHHTAIFLAKKLEDSMLQLTSDPLPLTLRNLDRVNAAVKGKCCVISVHIQVYVKAWLLVLEGMRCGGRR